MLVIRSPEFLLRVPRFGKAEYHVIDTQRFHERKRVFLSISGPTLLLTPVSSPRTVDRRLNHPITDRCGSPYIIFRSRS